MYLFQTHHLFHTKGPEAVQAEAAFDAEERGLAETA
jgi:hypothetical protein